MDEAKWIEADASWHDQDDDDDGDIALGDLFADPDPRETFRCQYGTYTIVLDGVKAENGQTLNSTGLTLWRASSLLCDYMIKHYATDIQGKQILELGAGLGLCGILASKLGAANVVMSDGDTDTLQEMRHNVRQNSSSPDEQDSNVCCQQLIWGRRLKDFQDHYGTFDVILASDVIYVEEILESFFETVVTLLKRTGKLLLAYARRNVSIDLVYDRAKCYGFQWRQPDGPEGVFVMQRES